MNAIFLAEVGLVNAVNLSEFDALLFQLGSSLFVVRSEGLAMTTPGVAEPLVTFASGR